mgnify:FL=1
MGKVQRAVGCLREVVGEIKKIVWPTRGELIGSSIVVCVLAVFFAIVLGGMDAGFSALVKKIIGS